MKRQLKSIVSIALTMLMVVTMVIGCSSGNDANTDSPSPSASQPATDSATPDAKPSPGAPSASPEDTAEPVGSSTKVLLVVSFGTSYNDTRAKTIDAIEKKLQDEMPDYEVRRAFTAQTIIDILKERENLEIDNVEQAIDRLVADGVKELVIQPTHIMNGYEYDDMIAAVTPYKDNFDSIKVGKNLLDSDDDYKTVANALVKETESYNDEETAIVFMGHGTEHESGAAYPKLQTVLNDAGHDNYFIGTVEHGIELDEVLAMVQESDAKKVVLLPLMVVAGDHATNDMASEEEEDSWYSTFTVAGYETEAALKGLGEYSDIQQLYVEHAKAATDL